MKLQPDRIDTQSITGYGPGWVAVLGEKLQHSVVVSSTGERFDWECASFDDLTPAHFERLLALPVEVMLFGSGARLRFVAPGWLNPLLRQRIGVETMDTAAACRTYNILAGEGRKVAVALLVEPAAQ